MMTGLSMSLVSSDRLGDRSLALVANLARSSV